VQLLCPFYVRRSRDEAFTAHPGPAKCSRIIRHTRGALVGGQTLVLYADTTSSVCTWNLLSTLGPKHVEIATSAASLPRAINTRPILGVL
jgi:hypothetical protein